MAGPAPDLRAEFNAWAAAGKGAGMARHHLAITGKALQRMHLAPGDRALDLGCGNGWAANLMAPAVGPRGIVVGVDISDAMIAEAQQQPNPPRNVRFLCAPAEKIPWQDNYFTHVLSVESFYYYADPRIVLLELLRVAAPGAQLFILICIYDGNPRTAHWAGELKVPVHVLAPAAWIARLTEAGWCDAAAEEFQPAAGDHDEHAQALLLTATKPVK